MSGKARLFDDKGNLYDESSVRIGKATLTPEGIQVQFTFDRPLEAQGEGWLLEFWAEATGAMPVAAKPVPPPVPLASMPKKQNT